MSPFETGIKLLIIALFHHDVISKQIKISSKSILKKETNYIFKYKSKYVRGKLFYSNKVFLFMQTNHE